MAPVIHGRNGNAMVCPIEAKANVFGIAYRISVGIDNIRTGTMPSQTKPNQNRSNRKGGQLIFPSEKMAKKRPETKARRQKNREKKKKNLRKSFTAVKLKFQLYRIECWTREKCIRCENVLSRCILLGMAVGTQITTVTLGIVSVCSDWRSRNKLFQVKVDQILITFYRKSDQ